jgi:hypothetical protein
MCGAIPSFLEKYRFAGKTLYPLHRTIMMMFSGYARGTQRATLRINALCIDQEDLAERDHQVAYMVRVFGQAERVVVWLGKDSEYPQTRSLFQKPCRYTKHLLEGLLQEFRMIEG